MKLNFTTSTQFKRTVIFWYTFLYKNVIWTYVSKGKLYYLKHLEKIIPENAEQELKELEVVNDKVIKRENSIKDFIEKAKSYLMSLKQFSLLIKYDHKIYLLRKLNNDLLINIEKLNLELLEYRNANRVIK